MYFLYIPTSVYVCQIERPGELFAMFSNRFRSKTHPYTVVQYLHVPLNPFYSRQELKIFIFPKIHVLKGNSRVLEMSDFARISSLY